jgi:putative component of membrane protein insertase Oxa1/YidC/SpoIIIJ protein YidD
MLAGLLIAVIHLYRILARLHPRSRTCLFAVSCSRYVERVASEQGFLPALRAMSGRFAACHPGYMFVYEGQGWHVICVNESVIDADDASSAVRDEAAFCRRALLLERNAGAAQSLFGSTA